MRPFLVASFLIHCTPVMAIDLAPLWDFKQPAVSEARFQAALETAAGDDAFILRTQIARTHGLRKDFVKAREILDAMAPQIETAGAEARARHALELGRTHASASHPKDALTDEARAQARAAFERALAIARNGGLDSLAIDAIHMFVFVDTAPADQIRWNREALALVEASTQPAAKKWEAAVRNNLGMALHGEKRYDEALVQFDQALAVRQRGTDAGATRIARWMVAWTMRSQGRVEEALAMQQALERDGDAAGAPDPYVYEELEALHRAKGELESAERYAKLRQAPVAK